MYNVDGNYIIAICADGDNMLDNVDVATNLYNCEYRAYIELFLNFKDLNKSANVSCPILIPYSETLKRYDFKNISSIGTVLDWDIYCDDLNFIQSKQFIDFIQECYDDIMARIKSGKLRVHYYHY